ncbi:MAG: rhodanese-like domain-containing protein [Deltaproteobacteria bacterium]|nr:rhodanese-like domain-containing protein [Deltaproteobacteria bacterium]
MIRRLMQQDLAGAGLILLLATALGLGLQWQLVRLSWTGGLPAYLEAQREQRLQKDFQGVKTLNLAQSYEMFQKGQALFVDARSAEEYAELHISGAVNLSRERLDQEGNRAVAGIPTERELVVYCGMASCEAALRAAEKLQSLGYSRVQVFMGGFRAWDDAGYPADTSK